MDLDQAMESKIKTGNVGGARKASTLQEQAWHRSKMIVTIYVLGYLVSFITLIVACCFLP